jgi:hypothetical protein
MRSERRYLMFLGIEQELMIVNVFQRTRDRRSVRFQKKTLSVHFFGIFAYEIKSLLVTIAEEKRTRRDR